MKIFIGADHNGFAYKKELTSYLTHAGHEVVDCGDTKHDPDNDFPMYAAKVSQAVLSDKDDTAKGIVICGSGQGVAMAANRFKGIRASLCWNLEEARLSRNDDDANVLCLSASQMDMQTVRGVVHTWLATPFAGAPRFVRRINQLDQLT